MKLASKIVAVVLIVAVSMGAGVAIYAQFGPSPEPVVEADSPTLTEDEVIAVVKTWLANRPGAIQNGVVWDCLSLYSFWQLDHWEARYWDDGNWFVTASRSKGKIYRAWVLYEHTLSVTSEDLSSLNNTVSVDPDALNKPPVCE